MSDSFIDHLPSQERENIRKRLRNPEEYERLREKVKGPEDLEREMERNAEFAEAKLSLESDPNAQEKAKDAVRAYVAEQGIDAALEDKVSPDMISKGLFTVIIIEKEKGEPKLAITMQPGENASSGNIAEILSLKPALQQQVFISFKLKNKS